VLIVGISLNKVIKIQIYSQLNLDKMDFQIIIVSTFRYMG